MKNTIYFDPDFNFLLLENEESENGKNSIYLSFHTTEEAGQTLKITVGDTPTQTIDLLSDTDILFNLITDYWAENGTTTIQLTNAGIVSATMALKFSKIPTVSAALNYNSDTELEMRYQGQETDSGGTTSGGFDFVESIRNIQFRLLDEPENVAGEYDKDAQCVKLSWTDPLDIATNEPVSATWAGTVVVRKENSAPLNRWDGLEIVDSIIRDEYSSGNELVDNAVVENKNYYYGIFPYDTRGWYRPTKIYSIFTAAIPIPEITTVDATRTIIYVRFSIPVNNWDYVKLVYKANAEPQNILDGTAIDIDGKEAETIIGLTAGTLYYLKIFAVDHASGRQVESATRAATTTQYPKILLDEYLSTHDFSQSNVFWYYANDGVPFYAYNSEFLPYYGTNKNLRIGRNNKNFAYDSDLHCIKNLETGTYLSAYYAIPLPQRIYNPKLVKFKGMIDRRDNTYGNLGVGQVYNNSLRQTKWTGEVNSNLPETNTWYDFTIRPNSGGTSDLGYTFYRMQDMEWIDYIVIEINSGIIFYKDIEIYYDDGQE